MNNQNHVDDSMAPEQQAYGQLELPLVAPTPPPLYLVKATVIPFKPKAAEQSSSDALKRILDFADSLAL